MYLKAVEYPNKGSNHFLAPGCEAFDCYWEWKRTGQSKYKQRLEQILVETDKAWRKLEGRP